MANFETTQFMDGLQGYCCSNYGTHSWVGHYFFSYLLTLEVDLIKILEIMPQMWQYVIFLSLKPTKVTSDFILNQLKKVVGAAPLRNIKNKY